MAYSIARAINYDIISIDNFYSEDELNDIMFELKFLVKNNKMKAPEHTGTARDESGAYKKSNKGLFLDEVYADRNVSDILRLNRKLFEIRVKDASSCFKALEMSNHDATLVSYYENKDFYDAHIDHSVLTAVTYFFEQPKKFSGGDLYFPEHDLTLECVHNRLYVFPGTVEHQVTEITMNKQYIGKGLGRFCLTQFLNFRN